MGFFDFMQEAIAIDLGTANTLIIHNDKVVVDQPSIVAKNIRTGEVVAIGKRAQQMHGKTHKEIETLRPLKDGVIADFQASEQMNTGLIVGSAIGLIGIIAVIIVLRGRKDDELSLAKKQNESSESDTSRPNIVRAQDAPSRSKPKSGPPPKKEVPSISSQNPQDISEAMAKLSLTDLPGRTENQKVSSYESLPAGGEYEYATEATYYSGENIGKWKLESDGSFTKIE